MYMNMDPSIRDEFWMELLKYYHVTMYKTLSDIVNGLATKTTLNSDVDDASTIAAAYHESLTLYRLVFLFLCLFFKSSPFFIS